MKTNLLCQLIVEFVLSPEEVFSLILVKRASAGCHRATRAVLETVDEGVGGRGGSTQAGGSCRRGVGRSTTASRRRCPFRAINLLSLAPPSNLVLEPRDKLLRSLELNLEFRQGELLVDTSLVLDRLGSHAEPEG